MTESAPGEIGVPVRWQVEDAVRFTILMGRSISRMIETFHKAKKVGFHKLKLWAISERIRLFKLKERENVLRVLSTSKRGKRNQIEKDILKQFIINNLKCIPSSQLVNSEMDRLCNEVDYFPTIGKSILFLQGDFGNVYYMIAYGAVSLYFEDSKDKEMQMGRELAKFRSNPLPADADLVDSLLKQMGRHLVTLPQGLGFGEFAILSTTQKLRSASAVAIADDSLMLILHADTYDAILKKFHYRQKALSSAIKLLQELPLFNFAGFTKISQLAYVMTNRLRPTGAMIATEGLPIRFVYLIAVGSVRVYTDHSDSFAGKAEKGLRLSLMTMGKGHLIGFTEVLQGQSAYQCTYVSDSADCEVYEMSVAAFRNYISSPAIIQTDFFKGTTERLVHQRQLQLRRIQRVHQKVHEIHTATAQQKELIRSSIAELLPEIVEDDGFTCSSQPASGSIIIESANNFENASICSPWTRKPVSTKTNSAELRGATSTKTIERLPPSSRQQSYTSWVSKPSRATYLTEIDFEDSSSIPRASTAQILLPTSIVNVSPSVVATGRHTLAQSITNNGISTSNRPGRPTIPKPSQASTFEKNFSNVRKFLEVATTIS